MGKGRKPVSGITVNYRVGSGPGLQSAGTNVDVFFCDAPSLRPRLSLSAAILNYLDERITSSAVMDSKSWAFYFSHLRTGLRLEPSLRTHPAFKLQTFKPRLSLHVLRRQASPLGRTHPNSQPTSRKFTFFLAILRLPVLRAVPRSARFSSSRSVIRKVCSSLESI